MKCRIQNPDIFSPKTRIKEPILESVQKLQRLNKNKKVFRLLDVYDIQRKESLYSGYDSAGYYFYMKFTVDGKLWDSRTFMGNLLSCQKE